MSIAERIKEARKAANLTQGDLGKLTGLAISTISSYENGVREPDVRNINRISKALNVSGDWLIESEYAYKDQEDRLIAAFRQLNNAGKDALIMTADAYTKIEAYKKESSQSEAI